MKNVLLRERIENNSVENTLKALLEANELLKAQDAVKGTLFKIKKDLDSVLDEFVKIGVLDKYKTVISPFNSGFMLEISKSFNRDFQKDRANDKIVDPLFSVTNIFLQPSSFFQSDLDGGKETAYIEGSTLDIRGIDKMTYPEYAIKSKIDIKTATTEFYNLVAKQIVKLNGLLK